MNKYQILVLIALSFSVGSFTRGEAAWGARAARACVVEDLPLLAAGEHYERAMNYYHEKSFGKAIKEFRLVAGNFPETSYGLDAYFFLGVCYYRLSELDLANDALSKYLELQSNPEFFYEAIEYKFHIAENFKNGAKIRLLGSKQLPKWSSSEELAIEIYDEVLSAVPNSDMAARSLYAKAWLLWRLRDYRLAVETYQALIARFPKSEWAAESYLMITRVFLEQCQKEFQNPDLLAFAEINVRRFESHFPGEERLELARDELMTVKEVYALGMYDTASFYERLNQPRAAVIYYQKVIVDFPETNVARLARARLSCFCPQALADIENCSVGA